VKNYDNVIMDCYKEIYKQSEPPADFEVLLENATIDQNGDKDIPFMDYSIDVDVMDKIIMECGKKHKLKKWEKEKLRVTIFLGCSPKSNKKIYEAKN
jgi:hypothetical protein